MELVRMFVDNGPKDQELPRASPANAENQKREKTRAKGRFVSQLSCTLDIRKS